MTPAATDETLVHAARAGDRDALDALLRRHIDRIHALCWRLTGNAADADDATQEALITIVRRLDRFDGRSAFSTWVYRVTVNATLDELRRKRRRPRPGLPDDQSDEARGEVADDGPPLDETVADRAAIDEALARLPHDYRMAVVLRDVAGLDYAEIAATLDIPSGTVRSRIARGRAQVARHLGLGDHLGNQIGTDGRPTLHNDETPPRSPTP